MNRLIGLCLMFFAFAVAIAEESNQRVQLVVEASIADVQRLEDEVVAQFRAADPTLSQEDAQAILRIDGSTDVTKCLEQIIIHALNKLIEPAISGISITREAPPQQPTIE